MKQNKTDRVHYKAELLLVLGLFVLVSIVSALLQAPITANDNKGWDGYYYYQIAEQMANHQPLATDAPFLFRPGTPFLASLVQGTNLLTSFLLVNLVANLAIVLLLVVWFRCYVADWRLRVLLCALFITQWHGPVRYIYFMHTEVDPWATAVLLLGLICLHKLSTSPKPLIVALLAVVVLVGVFFRESVLIVALAALFVGNPLQVKDWRHVRWADPHSKGMRVLLWLPLFAGIAGIAITHLVAHRQTNDYQFLPTAISWITDKMPWTWLLGWFISFGPVLLLLFIAAWQSFQFLRHHQFQLVVLLGVAGMSWLGGSDTERIAYWAAPVVYVIIAYLLESRAIVFSLVPGAFLLLAQSIAQRLYWTLPDYPGSTDHALVILTPVGHNFSYMDLIAVYGGVQVEMITLVEYAALWYLLHLMLKHREHMHSAELLIRNGYDKLRKRAAILVKA